MIKHAIREEVYLMWWQEKSIITEISIQPTKTEYKLWKPWTNEYTWYDSWQITKDAPSTIWFKTN